MPLHPVRFLLLLVGLVAATRPLAIVDTGTISGHVRDSTTGQPIPNVQISVAGTSLAAMTNRDGSYLIANVPVGTHTVWGRFIGYQPSQKTGVRVAGKTTTTVDFRLQSSTVQLQSIVVNGAVALGFTATRVRGAAAREEYAAGPGVLYDSSEAWRYQRQPGNREQYDEIVENQFIAVAADPLSTFSIDVDRASYSNMRRFIMQDGQLPPRDAVRIEELVNYSPTTTPSPRATTNS
jgi:Ca-activated chloride channel family protein